MRGSVTRSPGRRGGSVKTPGRSGAGPFPGRRPDHISGRPDRGLQEQTHRKPERKGFSFRKTASGTRPCWNRCRCAVPRYARELLKFKSDESVQDEQLKEEQKAMDLAGLMISEMETAQTEGEDRIQELEQEVKRLNKNINDVQQSYHTSNTRLESLKKPGGALRGIRRQHTPGHGSQGSGKRHPRRGGRPDHYREKI